MTQLRLSFVYALFAAACTGDPVKPDPTDTEEPQDPNDPAVLAACDESDLDIQPFMGPGFDPATGELHEPLPNPHLVATTVGWRTGSEEDDEILGEHTNLVIGDLFTREGLIGASFGTSEACGSARTLSLWRDEVSLVAFVTGEAHSTAIANALSATRAWETTHWIEEAPSEPPGWDDARAKLAAVRE